MIVGTAGHIDHGKTALVKALTGVDADRLAEEKARGITIDLGFAYMPAGDGVLGFVDVPGHDRFVRNMLAGATGIDFLLLTVAADDGVMPQTREHFDIVSLLGLSRGIVAMTKCDLVAAERRTEVASEIEALLAGSPFEGTPVMPVSTATGEGLEALRNALVAAAEQQSLRDREGLFRLAVDRSFSLQGVGTVVTGAVLSGSVAVDDTIVISPSGLEGRIRSIHAQNRPVRRGHVGERCALNLVGEGITVETVGRGDVVMNRAAHAPADRIDAELKLLASEPGTLKHWTPVRLHHAASDTSARIAVLQEEPLAPGGSGCVQLVLEKPIAAAVGDRFIIRDTSGSRTMGGGRLLDLRGPHRRRKTQQRLTQLNALARNDPVSVLAGLLERPPFTVDLVSFARDRAMRLEQAEAVLPLVPHVRVGVAEGDMLVSPDIWKSLCNSVRSTLVAYHRDNPQLLGPGVTWLAARLEPRLPTRTGAAIVKAMIADGTLAFGGGAVRLPEHRLALDKRDQHLWRKIEPCLSGDFRFRPPQGRECAELLDERIFDVRRVLKAMARQQSLIELAPDRFFLMEAVKEMAGIAADIAEAQEDGFFAAAQFRDRLQNGRKVAIEILEYFDRNGLTSRRGDLRRIVPHRLAEYTGATSASASDETVIGRESSPVGRPDFKSG
ncbi:selenocysteine-specific translation elongation factor [Oricola sp.]|uniref:selenocysteine-specific translation elongation factor n=1 Tax=Oricola sp. TaxID=1979950 RepID=UPI003517E961